ncbi:hypothetical protein L198_05114 [Cryptococcus wingfieldii CBS 7118]|uniref:Origin recognition complex subunit 5 C-terminal domain-containing protein n=1 Tax=Cryptococcus wingfieldii CBS 7118 TaxID=1295528 RepID=A0A1E3J0C2_9TREE|nr:hypothetical protein L198_05114 [Cryptococcus wingfieldii CBS 7118]ODN94258.1 hypothetical protein L198_05114 [Cryptococcus wingfieldii CBS 7118]
MADSIETLLSTPSAPPFVYLHHPHHSATDLPPSLESAREHSLFARLDTIEHYNTKLFYSGILHRILGEDASVEEVSSWDAFSLKLKSWWCERHQIGNSRKKVRGWSYKEEVDNENIVLLVTHAERLKNVLGSNWAVMTRLAELSNVNITVILASASPWDLVRPHRVDAPEPIHIYLQAPTRADILAELLPVCSHPLWPKFVELLLATTLSLITPPVAELAHIAASLWPLYTSDLPPHAEMEVLGLEYPDPSNPPPKLEVSLRLLTDLTRSIKLPLAAAVETLIPRQIGTYEFTSALSRRSATTSAQDALPKLPPLELSRTEKFLLVAGYCASYNPATSDVRLFGRGVGENGRKKRGGGMRRAGYGKVRSGKVAQRLLGPKAFPLDRLLALFFSLYAEHATRPDFQTEYSESSEELEEEESAQIWPPTLRTDSKRAEKKAAKARKREQEQEQRWDVEVQQLMMSVKFWGMIPELEAQGLLKRWSPPDRLDNVMLRCELDYETSKSLAKDLGVKMDEYLYEANIY